MYFQVLQRRLVGAMRARVRNGEWTERALARSSGVSQPHMHNVLKGVRILSPQFADRVLRQLKITILDLCEGGELTAGSGLGGVRWVPKLARAAGPGHPWTGAEAWGEGGDASYPFPMRVVGASRAPMVAILAPDERMAPRFRAGDTVLLDCAEESRLHPEPRGRLHRGYSGRVVGSLCASGRKLALSRGRR